MQQKALPGGEIVDSLRFDLGGGDDVSGGGEPVPVARCQIDLLAGLPVA